MKYSSFYDRPEWKELRYQALRKYGWKCQLCGRTKETGCYIQVDHIKPKSIYPELALKLENLQILCHECNQGKSNLYDDDHRPAIKMAEQPVEKQREPHPDPRTEAFLQKIKSDSAAAQAQRMAP